MNCPHTHRQTDIRTCRDASSQLKLRIQEAVKECITKVNIFIFILLYSQLWGLLRVESVEWTWTCFELINQDGKIHSTYNLQVDRLENGFDSRDYTYSSISKSQSPEFEDQCLKSWGQSLIPSMIKMLNDCQKKKRETFKKLDNMPVNYVLFTLYHCVINKPN